MRSVSDIFGKEIKSNEDLIMFVGHPGSDEIISLPAGRPSSKISSYLQSGYFEISGTEYGEPVNLYVKDVDSIELVEPGGSDESSYYSRLNNALFSTWFNTSGTVQKNLSFLGTGARESFAQLKIDTFDFGRYLNRLFILIIIAMALWLIGKLIP